MLTHNYPERVVAIGYEHQGQDEFRLSPADTEGRFFGNTETQEGAEISDVHLTGVFQDVEQFEIEADGDWEVTIAELTTHQEHSHTHPITMESSGNLKFGPLFADDEITITASNEEGRFWLTDYPDQNYTGITIREPFEFKREESYEFVGPTWFEVEAESQWSVEFTA